MYRPIIFAIAIAGGLFAAVIADHATARDIMAVRQSALGAFNAQDYATARQAFIPLAEAGDATAQFYLGIMRLRGYGDTVDPAAARRWLQQACAQGHAVAQFQLGEIYRQGIGGVADPATAAQWYTRAAEAGWFGAQMALAALYAAGDGVPHDPVAALTWYDIAAEMGLDPYNGARDALAATMGVAAIAEAGRRTRAWLGAHRRWDTMAIAATAAMSGE